MADIVARHIEGQGITDLWLAGGSCMQPGVAALFCKQFPALQVHLPQHSLFMTRWQSPVVGERKRRGYMQNELQTALFQAFDTLNLQRVKTFSVPPVTLCGPGAVSSCGQQAQTRGLKHLFVMADSFCIRQG